MIELAEPPVSPKGRLFWLLFPPLLLALLASWFAFPIREMRVSGLQRLDAAEAARVAGVGLDQGWLYYNVGNSELRSHPWIASAEVRRVWPDRIEMQITERQPFAVLAAEGRAAEVVARDGTVLPGASEVGLPRLEGWGPDRRRDSLAALSALAPYGVRLLRYTPNGLSAETTEATVWSGDLESLLKHASVLNQYPKNHIYIYPWGVSVRE